MVHEQNGGGGVGGSLIPNQLYRVGEPDHVSILQRHGERTVDDGVAGRLGVASGS